MSTLGIVLLAIVLLAIAYAVVSRLATRLLRRPTRVGDTVIGPLRDDTGSDPSGACRSVQSADLEMPAAALEAMWSPMYLERLARTYWRFLTRCTLGLIRVEYTEAERFVVLLHRPLVLLAFRRPEYEMDEQRGIVRWRIERGVLVAPPGREGDGYLEIDVRRVRTGDPARVTLHAEVEVANYYPRIAFSLARWLYSATQSRIHVIVTYGFLRSLAKRDLAESRVGRFADIAELPDPQGPAPSERGGGHAAPAAR